MAEACRRAPRAARPANSRIRRWRRRRVCAESAKRVDVVVGGAGEAGRDIGRGRVLVRVEDVAFVAELRRGDASIRPSWPPPTIPIVEPGGIVIRALRPPIPSASRARRRAAPRARSSLVASIAAARSAALIAPALPIASVPDRNAGRHLDDRQQAIHALERLAFDRNAEHGKRGHRRRHARQMSGSAGAGDDRP